MKGILQGFFLTVASVLLTLVLVESLFHMFPSLLPLAISSDYRGVAHSVIGNTGKPGSSDVIRTQDFTQPYQLDQMGFRNEGPWPSQADVVVIGDSLVFGYGVDVDHAWPQLLAGLSGRNVLNLGLIGASPEQYLRIYETFGRALKPKLVVVGFFPNDFWDEEQFALWRKSGVGGNYLEWRDHGRPKAEDLEHLWGRIKYSAKLHLYLVQLVLLDLQAESGHTAEPPLMLDWSDGETVRLDLGYLQHKTARAPPAFSMVLDSLTQLQRLATADGSQLLVVFQPSKERIYLPFVGQEPPHFSELMAAELEKHSISILQLIPAFKEGADAGEMLFFPVDGHPNAKGYRLIAEQVAAWLARNEHTPSGAVTEPGRRPDSS